MSRQTQTEPNGPIQFEDIFANRFAGPSANAGPIIDADFETVEIRPESRASGPNAKPSPTATPIAAGAKTRFDAPKTGNDNIGKIGHEKIGMSVFGKKPAKPAADDKVAFYGFGAVLVALSFWVFGGHSLFRNVDTITTSSIASTTATEIADASWRVVTVDGKSALHVEGVVRNSGKAAAHTKPVTVTVQHNDGSTKRYLLGQKGWTLGPGQEVVVSGRLDIVSASIASVVIALSN